MYLISLATATAILALVHTSTAWNISSIDLSPAAEVFYSSDPTFSNETTQRYTSHDAPTYFASVKPAIESDVQKLVKYASANNISFLATGGGHGFATTFGRLRNGLEIDLGFFKNLTIDSSASTMTIGGSVLIGDVIDPLYNAGKQLQTGSEKCVGVIGATLGGGVGRLNGLYGMMVDALLSVRMVTASGDIVNASETENPDLFWAIRGAGFNFGIIISATYQVHDLPNKGQVVNADFLFPLNQTQAVFQYFKSMEHSLPAELSLILQTGYEATLGGTYVVVNAVYSGPLANATALIQPLLNAHPLRSNITEVPYNELLSTAFFGTAPATAPCVKGTVHDVYGTGIRIYDVPTFQGFFNDLTHFFSAYPAAQGSVWFIEAFPMQAARAIPDSQTAYGHRDINAHLLFNYAYTDPSVENDVNKFAQKARARFAASSGFGGLQTYVSYGHGDESPSVLYGDSKLPKLRDIKTKWDPRGLFNFDQPFM